MAVNWNQFLCRSSRWILLVVFVLYICATFVNVAQRVDVIDEYLDAIECPKSAVFLDDGGRMGNQFFEYLEAKVFARQANRNLFIRRVLFDKFSSYFNGPMNRTFGSVNHLKQVCSRESYADFVMGYQTELPIKLRKQSYIILKRTILSFDSMTKLEPLVA
jgi:hypothetical protein